MLEITFHEDADNELKAAAVFYESRQAGLGDLFLERIDQGLDLIRAQPRAGQQLFDEFHRILTRQFPYSIVYRVAGDQIFIIAIAHWSRRPGYWKDRS
jgi:toxin ParE1/3/4